MSGLRCWPGCLAIQIRACLPENVGSVNEVIRLHGHDRDGPLWVVKPSKKARGVCPYTGEILGADVPGKYIVPDAWLRPITPPPGSETESSGEPIKEVA